MLVILGAPLIVLGQLVREQHPLVPMTEQPGGIIRGVVQSEEGEPLEDVGVELWLVGMDLSRANGGEARTDSQGRFQFDAKPCEGRYQLRVGDGTWRTLVRDHSLVGIPEDFELDFELEPGVLLTLALRRPDGRAVGDGRAMLTASLTDAPLLGLFQSDLRIEGDVRDGILVLDGLPACSGTLTILLDGGDTVSRELLLEAGERSLTWDLR